ncbi:Druantia anti-phage system protein DruA [Novosphingobium sp. HII-3]|uniref:Druantia anti-phage system protein DruA n=1 Tax=Novosphingobium sp. HII-3 TaxID=2075565 RepID=UPI001E406C61|nr:Druantia anti-phage system protein DruA [Novosphingobium sp. HII-3]
MSASSKLNEPGRSRAFSPFLAPQEHQRLQQVIDFTGTPVPGFADELRALARRFVDDGESLKLRAICLLLADLFEQGWSVSTGDDGGFEFQPPGLHRGATETVDDIKARVRQTMQTARLRQLAEPSVRNFLERTEKRRIRDGIEGSVLDLIDDGAALSRKLATISDLPLDVQENELAALVDPVIEVCEAGRRCFDTGLPLIDIWRYFRHTWAHEYRSIPGRQMLILIRNAARPNRPVMGIAMLASPVMRLTTRDQWIGWLPDSAKYLFEQGCWSATAFATALWKRVQTSISEIRWDDLATDAEIRSPSEAVIFRLEQRAAGAAVEREAELKLHFESEREQGDEIRPHRGGVKSSTDGADWLAASKDLLFVRKRAEGLAKLLFAKHVFHSVKLRRAPARALKTMFETRDGKRALDTVLAEFRKAGLSSEVADVSICGAVHPYNELLAGKLVALVLASQEVRDAYARRYGGQISIIASQMAGRPIIKSANLKLITTTSLYGVGSSQYNRLVLRATEHEGLEHDVRWGAIGKSLTGGFGTLHLGQETAQALRTIAFARHDARRVNNRFGEGTSPRLRQIREGLDALGIKSDAILHHATPRIFYGCELVGNARDALLGLDEEDSAAPGVAVIAAAWRRRWLVKRVQREETRAALARLGPVSVRASLHADQDGQFRLPIDND